MALLSKTLSAKRHGAIAHEFVAEGARVVVAGRDKGRLDDANHNTPPPPAVVMRISQPIVFAQSRRIALSIQKWVPMFTSALTVRRS